MTEEQLARTRLGARLLVLEKICLKLLVASVGSQARANNVSVSDAAEYFLEVTAREVEHDVLSDHANIATTAMIADEVRSMFEDMKDEVVHLTKGS